MEFGGVGLECEADTYLDVCMSRQESVPAATLLGISKARLL